MLYEEEIVNPYCLTNVLNLLDLKGLQKMVYKTESKQKPFYLQKENTGHMIWYSVAWSLDWPMDPCN